ncbi:hypothetical protein EYZ11_006414 [Aspergillus tanneri]|uniref:Uncharacterized protein n=1 Tax=Aspergillus tanneri TaxID=1220188 RepID=A0A4S3JG61_9EURO|nr:hypothetical protein EYZ11_006414 [Aspergillus tanneri]
MPSGPRFPHEAPLCRWCRVLSIAGFPSEDDDAVSAAVSCGLSCESLRAWSTIGTLAILDTLRVLWTVPAPLINWLSERKSLLRVMMAIEGYRD